MSDAVLKNVLDGMPIAKTADAPAPPPRYHELDSIRGLAALTVVFHHFHLMWILRLDEPHLVGWRRWLDISTRAVTDGNGAVLLFFILSGFVLSVPYLRGKGQSYGTFVLRRIIRIYAPYLCALALAVAGNAIWHGPLDHGWWASLTWANPVDCNLVLRHIAFIGDYNWSEFNTAFWSLVMEMRLSLVFPLLFAAVLMLRNVGALILALVLCFLVPHIVPNPAIWPTFAYTLQIASLFIIGILLAKNIDTLSNGYRRLAPIFRIFVAVASASIFLMSSRIIRALGRPWGVDVFLFALATSTFILIGISSPHVSRLLNTSIPRFLGRISYSLYLIHGTVLFAITYSLGEKIPAPAQFLLYFVLSMVLATVFCFWIEEPCMRLSRQVGRLRRA